MKVGKKMDRVSVSIDKFFSEIFIWIWFVFVFYVLFSNIFRRAREKQLYRAMISTPNDNPVNNYIKSFKKINGFASMVFNLFFSSQHVNDKIRQAQGYDIIKACSSVSATVKEQLKIVFVSNGIQIK